MAVHHAHSGQLLLDDPAVLSPGCPDDAVVVKIIVGEQRHHHQMRIVLIEELLQIVLVLHRPKPSSKPVENTAAIRAVRAQLFLQSCGKQILKIDPHAKGERVAHDHDPVLGAPYFGQTARIRVCPGRWSAGTRRIPLDSSQP